MMKDYKTIFDVIESTLISRSTLGEAKIRECLEQFRRLEGRAFSDDEYYWILVYVVFYSGFKAATVTAKLDLIRRYFSDFRTVADYTESDVERIMGDQNMIRNERKVRACIENARTFKSIVAEYGSFQKYIGSFAPTESFENLMLLKEELVFRFGGFGNVTPYHFLTDIGMRVLKPDRVVCRIFQRLGLIESEEQFLKTVIQGRKFADATGHPIRYIDIVFAAYGQVKSEDLGIEKGICLKDNPECPICGARNYCGFLK
jgi:DNA-3-methyladenine glycosylase I